jgi:hypothetical protein
MLEKDTEKQILSFVYQQPRSIQEIAQHIDRNWRTADTYVEKIAKESGSLGMRTFRGGTRGALKIVFWLNAEKIHSSEFQQRLFGRIEHGRRKEDFSPFELYAYVPEQRRRAWKASYNDKQEIQQQDTASLLASAQEQVLVFTGNCSFINLVENGVPLLSIIQELVQRGVSVKVLSRVDLASVTNLQKVFAINYEQGKELIEVRHCEQPLRGFVVDNKIVRLKEELDPAKYRKGELDKHTVILYEFYDPEWVAWTQNVFWTFFRSSLAGQKRLEDLRTIQKFIATQESPRRALSD